MQKRSKGKECVELVAPAKDLECGKAAIDHGADAVYIGGPLFSARAAATNSLPDIGSLIEYAHLFKARVYLALNTLLYDKELEPAVDMINAVYDMGADGLILQDLGLLECGLPPIPLHASTQTDVRTPEKVRFLEKAGFEQVVLARELSLEQIREIADCTSVTLECFVHGALCVSYSGRCYISEVMADRSANRGECAQFCRHSFTLRDGHGRIVEKDKHLLSLKDLFQLNNIESLLLAGVRSFKIEGRLKDIHYVKNITALYRQRIDTALKSFESLRQSSSGSVQLSFEPDETKTFFRGGTDYFLAKQRNRAGAIHSPKSQGEFIGTVYRVERDRIEIKTTKKLNNGDGFCFFTTEGQMEGFRVNRVSENVLFPARRITLSSGTKLYRNYDSAFLKQLDQSKNTRKIQLQLFLSELESGLHLMVVDEDGIESENRIQVNRETAKKPELTIAAITKQLGQSGETPFRVKEMELRVSPESYYAGSVIKRLRREALNNHLKTRIHTIQPKRREVVGSAPEWGDYDFENWYHITNEMSKKFYRKCGIDESDISRKEELMRCKYCIKAQLRCCPEENGEAAKKLMGSLVLSDNVADYRLHFDCKKCEMILTRKSD